MMNDNNYLEWFVEELEKQYDAYSSSTGNEKEGRKLGIKNFLVVQKDEIDKIVDIREFNDAVGTPFTWNNLIEPYFFDNDIMEFIRQLKSKLTMNMNFSFKNREFDKLFKMVQNEVKSLVEEKEIELKDGELPENFVMWQMNNAGEYLVHPSDSCPDDLKASVMEIIVKHNPTI